MKKKSLYFLLFTLGILFAINACTKRPETVKPSDDSFNNYFAGQRNKVQTFTLNAETGDVITGDKGTKVYIGAGTLRTMSGQQVKGTVTIELKEITQFSDMVLNTSPTISKGKLLKSGGEFHISAKQNGTPLTLAQNASYFINIEAPHGTSDSMKVFTGADSSGVIIWTPVETDTVNNNIQLPDTAANKIQYDTAVFLNSNNTSWGIVNSAYAYMVKCNSFGWINADYFIEMQYANLCEQTVICDPSLNLDDQQTRVYYLLPASNSCAMLYHNQDGFVFTGGVPNNQHIKIVAFSNKDGKSYVCVMDHYVNSTDSKIVVLNFIEVQESQVESYLSQINI